MLLLNGKMFQSDKRLIKGTPRDAHNLLFRCGYFPLERSAVKQRSAHSGYSLSIAFLDFHQTQKSMQNAKKTELWAIIFIEFFWLFTV